MFNRLLTVPCKLQRPYAYTQHLHVAACVNNHSKIPDLQKHLNKRLFCKKVTKQTVMTSRYMKTFIKITKCRAEPL